MISRLRLRSAKELSNALLRRYCRAPSGNQTRLVMARQLQKTFNCINDNLDHDGGDNSLGGFSNLYFELAFSLGDKIESAI